MPVPRRPYPEFTDYDSLMADAKQSLGPQSVSAPEVPDVEPAPVDDSFWGKIKRVANYSPLPEDIGDKFAESVDPASRRGSGFGSVVKSGVAGAGKGFLDLLRSQTTPAGLATMGNPTSGAGRLAAAAGSAVYAGEGAETLADDDAGVGDKALGASNVLMGLLGLHGAATAKPHVPGRNINEGRFSKPVSEADRFNGDPVEPSAPASSRRHPMDLFDTPEFRAGEPPVPSRPEPPPPNYDTRRPARTDQPGVFEGAGADTPPIPVRPENPLLKILSARTPYLTVDDAALPDDAIFQRTMGGGQAEAPVQGDLIPASATPEPVAPVPSPEPAPSARYLAEQDDFNGGSFALYNIEGGPLHGSTVTAETLAEHGIPVPERTAAAVPPVQEPPKPKLAAPDVAAMLAGREKFAAANPGAEIAPGMSDELDRSGVEYNRAQRELKRLLGLPDADPAEVARMKQGARELGQRLRTTANDATIRPLPDLPEGFEALNAELGDLNTPAPSATHGDSELARLLQATIDTQDAERAARQAAGTGLGRDQHFKLPEPSPESKRAIEAQLQARDEYMGRALPDERPAPVVSEPGGELIQDPREPSHYVDTPERDFLGNERGEVDPYLLAKFLGRPIAGAAVGGIFGDPEHRGRDMAVGAGVGAASNIGLERLRYASMLTGLAQAKNIVGDVGVVGHTAAERALTHGPSAGGKVLSEFFSPETAREYVDMLKGDSPVSLARLDRPESASAEGLTGLPFRTMGAADTATQSALTRAGVTDAADRTMTGDPKSAPGQAAMQFQRKGGSLARFIAPFVKTAINQTEAAVTPFQNVNSPDPAVQKQAIAKIALLLAGGGAGAAYGSTDFAKDHPKTSALTAALAGPGQVPFALGGATAAALKSGKTPVEILKAVSKTAFDQLPLPSDWIDDPTLAFKSLAPAGLDMINPDDTPRDTTRGIFDALISRLPFLSTTLPAKHPKRRAKYTNE